MVRRSMSVADRGRAQHAEVKGAVAQAVALGGGEQVGLDLQRHPGQLALDQPGDAGQLGERGGAGEAQPDQPAAARGDAAYAAHGVVDAGQDPRGLAVEELAGGGEGTWRVVRVNSVASSSASSWRIACESAGWATCSCAAACPKWQVSATAAK